MAVSNPTKGEPINADLINSWQTELQNWAKISTTPRNIESGSNLQNIASNLTDLIDTVSIEDGEIIKASTANSVAEALFSKLISDPVLNYNADDKTALWANMPKSGNNIIYTVSTTSKLITAGDTILDIPNTIKNLQNIVKCYNLFSNAYGTNSNTVYSNGTDSNTNKSNGTNSKSCSYGSNSNGQQYVSNQSIKNTYTSNPGKCTGYQCYNGYHSSGSKTNTCSSGTCSSGVNSNSANSSGIYSNGVCTSGTNSNQLNSNTDKSNGYKSNGTRTNTHAPITNSFVSYSETPQAFSAKHNGGNIHGANTICDKTCSENNKCSWSACPNGYNTYGICSSGTNQHTTCSSGSFSHGTNSHGTCSCGSFSHGTCTHGQCQHGFKVNIRCNHTTNSNTST